VSPTGLCTDASGNYIPNPVNDAAAAGELNVWGGILATLWEPADWAATFGRWWHGDFSYWDLAGLLPLVPASGARVLGKRIVRYVDVVPTGQWHHVFSNKIMQAIEEHRVLSGKFRRNDVLVRAMDRESHIGYQKWHRAYDKEVVDWLRRNPTASADEFIGFLTDIHSSPDMVRRFPFALDALHALQTRFK